jgi:PKD repeat protein
MKTKHILPVVLICAGLFSHCKKKELPEAEPGNDPQFFFTGTVNGSPVRIDAGINDYYMHSSYSQASNGCYSFQAHLKPINCGVCPNSIRIELNDHVNSPMNGISGADSAFVPTCYPYYTTAPGPITYTVQFFALWQGSSGMNYQWNFGDGTSSNAANPLHTFKRPGEYTVSLTATDTTMCSSTISNVQKFGITDNRCNTTISVSTTSSTNTSFNHITTGAGQPSSYSFFWDFGDSYTSTQSLPTHSYVNQGMYPVSLEVTDSTGNKAKAYFNYSTPSNTVCAVNYIILSKGDLPNNSAWSNVIIKWYDSSGTEYSSASVQPSSSYFRILSSEDYHSNENGQSTKKLHVKFSCRVYSGSSSMDIKDAEAVVVVAYK